MKLSLKDGAHCILRTSNLTPMLQLIAAFTGIKDF